jgi:hypothetical protein
MPQRYKKSSSDLKRGKCVLAICATNYKRALCKAQRYFRTFVMLHICTIVRDFLCIKKNISVRCTCAANYKRGFCNAQISFHTFVMLHICTRVGSFLYSKNIFRCAAPLQTPLLFKLQICWCAAPV